MEVGLGLQLGNLEEAKLLVEAQNSSGTEGQTDPYGSDFSKPHAKAKPENASRILGVPVATTVTNHQMVNLRRPTFKT